MKSGIAGADRAELHCDPIRNIALLGHAGCGKSSLIEALLLQLPLIR
ncbi:hypothetical protein [Endozoicomonas acroporae]|nr:hypothetical protein [Endozoicomonas acroporae]